MSQPLARVSMHIARRRQTFEIDREAIIGSDPGCQIVIGRIAPRQARILLNEAAKRFVIENLGAPGSLHVDGAVVTGSRPLGAMSVITLGGSIELVFEATPSPEEPPLAKVEPKEPPEAKKPRDPRRTIEEEFEPGPIDVRGAGPGRNDLGGTVREDFAPDMGGLGGTVRENFEPGDKIDVRGTVHENFEPGDKIDIRGTVREDFEPGDKIDVRGTVREDFEPNVPGAAPGPVEPPQPPPVKIPSPPAPIAATQPAIQATQPAMKDEPTIEATRPIPKRPSPRLVITDPPELAFAHPLPSGEILVGKAPECAIRITHWSVSRKHALLIVREGVCRLKELGSMNGTFLDGRRIEGEVELPAEATLTFGEVVTVVSTRPR